MIRYLKHISYYQRCSSLGWKYIFRVHRWNTTSSSSLVLSQCRVIQKSPPHLIHRNFSSEETKAVGDELSIEEQYSRKTPLEHILLRPGMYIGPTDKSQPAQCWIPHPLPANPRTEMLDFHSDFKPNNESNRILELSQLPSIISSRMVQEKLAYYPALIKIFDEILVNAFDNRLRHDSKLSTTQIDVIIHPGCKNGNIKPYISVTNNGKGIPIQIHQQENMYLPEMLFGHLLTGSNFDDANQKKLTGGRHGYGAKLTNIFSKEFVVETLDSIRKKRYMQKWEDNMRIMHDAEIQDLTITAAKAIGDYTRVAFVPDLEKLAKAEEGKRSHTIIPKSDYAIMCRRVFDIAGCSGGKITVTLNGHVLPIGSFEDYARLFYPDHNEETNTENTHSSHLRFQKLNQRWEIGVGPSSSNSFESFSFVNGMDTIRGGNHVNVIVQQISNRILEKIAKEYPELAEDVNPSLVRRHLCIFVNALIENPTFDSQMKEYLTSSPNDFGSRYTLSAKFLDELVLDENEGGPGIVEQVIRSARGRQQATLLKHVGGTKKSRRQLLNIPKLDDAHLAGGKESCECTLILTEGDSAKALAVAGLEVIGRQKYGVFPLRGKFLNVRDAPVSQLANNAEVKALCTILGLDFQLAYETKSEREKLRYGHVMLMTDQDADGSHIKGLIINFFRHFWPNLLRVPIDAPDEKPFLSSFITPLMKATRKAGKKETISFYSIAEYNSWRNELGANEIKQWNIKYYKGLGTSTHTEAKEYFKDFENHHRPFEWKSDLDGELVDMVFEKDRASDRREWLMKYDKNAVLPDESTVSYESFINNEMIHFSNADNIRSLPSVVDGLKPSQRKVLYACFKRNLRNEIKVAQLAGYCAEHTAYHHGEASLHATITGMAQDFVGSNNVNLLEPRGQFGTRMAAGKDAASPRYIFTRLSPISRVLFPEVDDALLDYLEDDGTMIEPRFYCPIIPLLLVNGSQGIGTGWSTTIPAHDIYEVMEHIRGKLNNDESLCKIRPWSRGFTGRIELNETGTGYRSIGVIEKKSKTSVVISELPIGKWTNDYKNHLLKMQSRGEVDSFIENHTTNTVSFIVTMKAAQLNRIRKNLEKAFKLDSQMLLTNMNAFDSDMCIQKFDSPDDIVNAYFPIRMGLYHDRKIILESSKEYSTFVAQNKARFIEHVMDGTIDLLQGKKSKIDTVHNLEDLGFASMPTLETIFEKGRKKKRNHNWTEVSDTKTDVDASTDTTILQDEKDETKSYDYLLNLPLASLTSDRIDALRREAEKTEEELKHIRNSTAESLWHGDLDTLDEYLHKNKMYKKS